MEVLYWVSRLDDLHAWLNLFLCVPSDLRDTEKLSLGGEFSMIWSVELGVFLSLSLSQAFFYSMKTSRPDLWVWNVVFCWHVSTCLCVFLLCIESYIIFTLCNAPLCSRVIMWIKEKTLTFVKQSWPLIQCFKIQTNHIVGPWNQTIFLSIFGCASCYIFFRPFSLWFLIMP